MFVPNFMQIHLIIVLIVALEAKLGITKFGRIHHLGTMNICIKIHDNPSFRCWDISHTKISQGITEVSRMTGNMNVCTNYPENPSKCCWDISVWIFCGERTDWQKNWFLATCDGIMEIHFHCNCSITLNLQNIPSSFGISVLYFQMILYVVESCCQLSPHSSKNT